MIHPTAIIDPSAVVPDSNSIGAHVIIGANVVLGENNTLHHHAQIVGNCTVGDNNQFFPFSLVALPPQDISYREENTHNDSFLTIGNNNILREYITVHRGTKKYDSDGITKIGNDNLLLTATHIAHDVQVHNNVIVSGGVIAGHVILEDHAIIGLCSAVHQFCHIGQYAMISGMSFVSADIPPFAICNNNNIRGINIIGLQRNNFTEKTIAALASAFAFLRSNKLLYTESLKQIQKDLGSYHEIQQLLSFLTQSKRKANFKKLD